MTYICYVKHTEKQIGTFLISLAIFLVFGNMAFANVTFSDKNKTPQVFHLQADDNEKPFVFNEISIGEGSQSVSQNEYLGTGFSGVFYATHNFSNVQISTLFYCSYSAKDKRESIFKFLFPFHFFW